MIYSESEFIVVPKKLLEVKDPLCQILLVWMCKNSSEKGIAYTTTAELSRNTGIKSKKTIKEKIDKLNESGYISFINYGGKSVPVISISDSSKPIEVDIDEPSHIEDETAEEEDVTSAQIASIITIFRKFNPLLGYSHKYQRDASKEIIKLYGFENAKQIAEKAIAIQGEPYAPIITTPNELKNKMAKLELYVRSKENSSEW